MRGRVILVGFLLLGASNAAHSACIDSAQIEHSTVSLARNFDEPERKASPVIGIRGAGWFLSPTIVVTAQHVADAMELSTTNWQSLEIVAGGGNGQFIPARLQRTSGEQAEKLAIIELQSAIPAARKPRRQPLLADEQVITFSYATNRPHPVQGRFVRLGHDGKLAGLALLEFYEGNDRLVIDHGASGAPVIDCEGLVAAVVTNVFTYSMWWASREIRISTAWGSPNVVSVPIQSLDDPIAR